MPVPGRSIFASLTPTRDAFAYARARGFSGVFVALDQAKAFDNVEHGYLFAVLRCFVLDAHFILFLRSLYAGLSSELIVNGSVAGSFSVSRGVLQGCPLSPTLFFLALDPLLRRVAADRGIRGFPLVGHDSVSISAYADGISLSLRDMESFRILLSVFQSYALLSGAQLNASKSHALRFGAFGDPLPVEIPFVEAVRILGVLFDARGVSPRAWDEAVVRAARALSDAALFNLSLSTKIAAALLRSLLHEWLLFRGTPQGASCHS